MNLLDIAVGIDVRPNPAFTTDAQANQLATELVARLYTAVQEFARDRLYLGQDVSSSADTKGLHGDIRFSNVGGGEL